MKELILSHLRTVQSVIDDTLSPLKDKHDPFGHFNFYWDELAFINWMKKEDPTDYEVYDLETCFEILDEFGDVFVKLVEPARLKYIYRHDDGILNIDVPLPKMIKTFYEYIINLQESELNVAAEAIANAASLSDVMNAINLIGKDVKQVGADVTVIGTGVSDVADGIKEVGSAVRNAPVIDPDFIADKFVDRLIKSPKQGKTLSKAEQFQADLTNKIAQDNLQHLKNLHKIKK
jgi:hypothetical protein